MKNSIVNKIIIYFFYKDREEVNCKDLEEIKELKDLLEFFDKKYFVFNNVIYL